MGRILIIDDEAELVSLLEKKLTRNGHEVLTAGDGERGVRLAEQKPDLILLDIMMPEMDGFTVCRTIRDRVSCPILFLSARQSEMDKIKGFTLGGDDYITKPFGIRELMARIEANLRLEQRSRSSRGAEKRSSVSFGALDIDIKGRVVMIHGKEIPLTKTEYDIVELLAFHAGQVFSREQIYERVWGYDGAGDNTTVVERIKKTRAKFAAAAPEESYISTVWGIGYKWNPRRKEDL